MRVLLLVHEDLIPPESIEGLSDAQVAPFKTEFDVFATLGNAGHDVLPVGVGSDLAVLKRAVEEFQPDVAFNLLEEFGGMGVFDAHVVSYLEMIRLPYTGCNPRGLMLARNKAIAKMIVRYHRIPAPRFHVFPLASPRSGSRGRVRKPKRLAYPLIVKSLTEEGSAGIAQASIVHDDEKLEERVRFIHRQLNTDALVETFIPGRELYVGVIGNDRLTTLPPWEVFFDKLRDGAPKIATSKVKWDETYQKKIGLTTGPAKELPGTLATDLPKLAKRTYRALQLSGYCRMDFRVAKDGKAYLLEANPNPQIMFGEDFAESADHGGLGYEKLLEKIINLGRKYRLVGQS